MAINSSLSVSGFCQLRGEQTVGRCVLAKARHSEKEPSSGQDGSKSQPG